MNRLYQHLRLDRGTTSDASRIGSCFVPKILVNLLSQSHELVPQSFFIQGVCLLVDISGFTKLSSSFCSTGRSGIDQLQIITNDYMGELVQIISAFGGDVIKFAGDAIICLFTDPNSVAHSTIHNTSQHKIHTNKYRQPEQQVEEDVVLRAIHCAECLKEVQTEKLTVHVAITCGEICVGLLGGFRNQWECLISGLCIHELSSCLDDAQSKQVVISARCLRAAEINVQNDCGVLVSKLPSSGNYRILDINDPCIYCPSHTPAASTYCTSCATGSRSFYSSSLSPSSSSPSSPPHSSSGNITGSCINSNRGIDMLEAMVPAPLAHSSVVDVSGLRYSAEIREVTTMFMKWDSYQAQDQHRDLMSLQAYFVEVQKILHSTGAFLRQFLVDDKGCVLIACWGVPSLSYLDNAHRALSCAHRIRMFLMNAEMQCSFGVTTGDVYCGTVGSTVRMEYAVIGSVVNMAARLMGKAKGGILIDDTTYSCLPRSQLHLLEALPPMIVKGRDEPLQVYQYSRDCSSSPPYGYAAMSRALSSTFSWATTVTSTAASGASGPSPKPSSQSRHDRSRIACEEHAREALFLSTVRSEDIATATAAVPTTIPSTRATTATTTTFSGLLGHPEDELCVHEQREEENNASSKSGTSTAAAIGGGGGGGGCSDSTRTSGKSDRCINISQKLHRGLGKASGKFVGDGCMDSGGPQHDLSCLGSYNNHTFHQPLLPHQQFELRDSYKIVLTSLLEELRRSSGHRCALTNDHRHSTSASPASSSSSSPCFPPPPPPPPPPPSSMRSGSLSVVLAEGTPGSGRSSLVRWMACQAQQRQHHLHHQHHSSTSSIQTLVVTLEASDMHADFALVVKILRQIMTTATHPTAAARTAVAVAGDGAGGDDRERVGVAVDSAVDSAGSVDGEGAAGIRTRQWEWARALVTQAYLYPPPNTASSCSCTQDFHHQRQQQHHKYRDNDAGARMDANKNENENMNIAWSVMQRMLRLLQASAAAAAAAANPREIDAVHETPGTHISTVALSTSSSSSSSSSSLHALKQMSAWVQARTLRNPPSAHSHPTPSAAAAASASTHSLPASPSTFSASYAAYAWRRKGSKENGLFAGASQHLYHHHHHHHHHHQQQQQQQHAFECLSAEEVVRTLGKILHYVLTHSTMLLMIENCHFADIASLLVLKDVLARSPQNNDCTTTTVTCNGGSGSCGGCSSSCKRSLYHNDGDCIARSSSVLLLTALAPDREHRHSGDDDVEEVRGIGKEEEEEEKEENSDIRHWQSNQLFFENSVCCRASNSSRPYCGREKVRSSIGSSKHGTSQVHFSPQSTVASARGTNTNTSTDAVTPHDTYYNAWYTSARYVVQRSAGFVTTLKLHEYDCDEIDSMLTDMLGSGATIPSTLAASIHDFSGGGFFWTKEILLFIREHGVDEFLAAIGHDTTSDTAGTAGGAGGIGSSAPVSIVGDDAYLPCTPAAGVVAPGPTSSLTSALHPLAATNRTRLTNPWSALDLDGKEEDDDDDDDSFGTNGVELNNAEEEVENLDLEKTTTRNEDDGEQQLQQQEERWKWPTPMIFSLLSRSYVALRNVIRSFTSTVASSTGSQHIVAVNKKSANYQRKKKIQKKKKKKKKKLLGAASTSHWFPFKRGALVVPISSLHDCDDDDYDDYDDDYDDYDDDDEEEDDEEFDDDDDELEEEDAGSARKEQVVHSKEPRCHLKEQKDTGGMYQYFLEQIRELERVLDTKRYDLLMLNQQPQAGGGGGGGGGGADGSQQSQLPRDWQHPFLSSNNDNN